MDDEYIRLVLAKINDMVENGKSLPCEWNYDKPGGYSSNIEEDKALSFLNNTGVIDLEPLEAERTIPVFCQKDDGSLGYKSKIIRTHSGSRQIKTNGIHYNLLQLANKKYKLPSNIKKVAELRLSSDKKIAYIVVDKHRYLIKGFRKTSGTKRQVFLDAYKSDEKPIYVGTSAVPEKRSDMFIIIVPAKTSIKRLKKMRYSGEADDDEWYFGELEALKQEKEQLEYNGNDPIYEKKDWKKIARDSFSLARYAKEDFLKDDRESKRAIISRLSEKIEILDRTVIFTPVKYLVPILKMNEKIEQTKDLVRTNEIDLKKTGVI